MKLFQISLILFFISSAVYAQSNYHEGFVLKNNGDTVKGYINYHEWTISPKVIDFKVKKDDKNAIHFRPEEIKKFQINNMETFVSYIGIISNNKISFPDYPESLDTSKVLDTIFLQQIATGKHVTLYYNNDHVKTRFFVAEKNALPVELRYYIYYNSNNQVIVSPVFTGELQVYVNQFAPNSRKLINRLANIDYDRGKLQAFINILNGVDGSNTANRKKTSRFYIGAAVSSTITKFSQYSGNQTATSVSPKINFGIDLFNNPNIQQVIFRTEVSLWYAMPRFNTPGTIGNNSVTTFYEFNQYNATITPQVLLNLYNKDDFKVYIDAGWALNLSTYTNNKITIKNEDPTSTATYPTQKPYDLAGFWTNFPVQVGVVLNKRIEIYASYALYAAYTQYNALSVANQSTNVGVKYLFK